MSGLPGAAANRLSQLGSQQQGQSGAGQPAPAQQQQQGLPPTGLQQQLASLNSFYSQVGQAGKGVKGMGRLGFDVRQRQFGQAEQMGAQAELGTGQIGSSSLDSMVRNLAQRYGMPIGRGRLVDDQGNLLMDPEQMANASGGSMTSGEAAAKMNYLSQAVAQKKNEQQQQKGIAALQTGMGLVQSRGRGSMASMMSGQYEALANIYTGEGSAYEAQDFSFYIQKEQLDIQQELQRRQERLAKKQARAQMFVGIGMTVAGIMTGGVAGAGLIASGGGMAAGGAANTGWF